MIDCPWVIIDASFLTLRTSSDGLRGSSFEEGFREDKPTSSSSILLRVKNPPVGVKSSFDSLLENVSFLVLVQGTCMFVTFLGEQQKKEQSALSCRFFGEGLSNIGTLSLPASKELNLLACPYLFLLGLPQSIGLKPPVVCVLNFDFRLFLWRIVGGMNFLGPG